MRIEEISEPIGVLAACSGGQMRPLRFRWKGRDYPVEAINGRWIDRGGAGYSLHYSVQADGQTYYLHFAGPEVQWWLDKTLVE